MVGGYAYRYASFKALVSAGGQDDSQVLPGVTDVVAIPGALLISSGFQC